jgi:hypothetical protein
MKIGPVELTFSPFNLGFKMPFDGALRGIGGEYEIARVLGGFGALMYCICANAFVGYEVVVGGKDFDITAYCLAFPGGLVGIIGAAAGAVALKDRNVASSKYIERHGVVPSKQPEPPLAANDRRNALGDPVADEETPAGTADDPVHVTEVK